MIYISMIINIASDGAIGATFLSWSLYFLSGKTEYFEFKYHKQNVPLTDNPLTDQNAHNHSNNQFYNFDGWATTMKNITGINKDDLHILAVLVTHESTEEEMLELVNFYDKNIILTVPDEHHFYHQKYKHRALFRKFSDPTSRCIDEHDYYNDFLEYYYGDSKQSWEDLGLTEVWDKREFLALNLRPRIDIKITDFVKKLNKDNFYLDSRDLWCTLDNTIIECLEWIGVPLDQDRYNKWLEVYHEWRKIHQDRIRFAWYFEKIISAIVNNDYIDLKRFDLDLVQEAIIQHDLIYKHNLNLKTYKLEKFTDTMQLHSLLEENIHPVDNIYYP